MNIKRTVKKLVLYESDLYEDKIVILNPNASTLITKDKNTIIQTDATCWSYKDGNFLFKDYNYILLRRFEKFVNIQNEIYYNIDSLTDKGLKLSDLFPIYPNRTVMTAYLSCCDMSQKSKERCLNYAKSLTKTFYK